MAGDKVEPLVEAVRLGARVIAGQLDQTAALAPGDRDGMADELFAQSPPAAGGADPDPLDLPALHAVARKAGNDGELQAAEDGPGALGDQQEIPGLRSDVIERLEISL